MTDQEHFEAVMRANGPRIYTLAFRLAGNVAEGHDLAQDTFVKAWEHWSDFRGEAQAGTWLYRICVNLWKNRLRSQARRSFWKHFSIGGSSAEDAPPLDPVSPEPGPSETLERQDRHAALSQALAVLEASDRAILVMRELDEKSYEEIAALLEVPLGTVRSRLARAREKLVKAYEGTSL